ncbi:SidA/IucD/PvdA family monooxygenase [Halapricum sp. CBA1109]|nr:FAD-dependent oxidoreductase [Halapricum sp. CBA1109]MUV88652.1 SidA/IucD/PvdA family monooxygenase [Halapricum sp. CBA1109]
MQRQYVIVGGNAAGMSAATRLRRLDETATIVVFEQGEHVSYASCGLPYHLSGTVPESELAVMGAEQLSSAFDLDIRTGTAVTDIDTEAQAVEAVSSDGDSAIVAYDDLVLATGAAPLVPSAFDVDGLDHCHTLRTVSDATTIRDRVDDDGRALVVGGGYIGLEAAENLSEAGQDVVVAELRDQVMPETLGPEMAAIVESHLREQGVTLRLDTGVDSLSEPRRRHRRRGDGRRRAAVRYGRRRDRRLAPDRTGRSGRDRAPRERGRRCRQPDANVRAVDSRCRGRRCPARRLRGRPGVGAPRRSGQSDGTCRC